ncbi:unnamed protein product [Trichobilharzia szidati]|nr:unnamed protein product [Trichobilharzia szidati]
MQSNTKFPILSLKRLRQRNLRLTCHYTTFYRRYKRNYAQLLASMSTEAVTPAVLPVEVESSSVNTDTMTVETEVVSSPPCSSLTPYNRQKKTYVVLTKPGVNEYFLAAKRWMLTDNVCLYPSSVTECEVEACVNPAVNWLIVPCQIVVEKDSFLEAKDILSVIQRMKSIMDRSGNFGEPLSLTNSKRQRMVKKDYSSYVNDCAKLESVEAHKVCGSYGCPDSNIRGTVISPIARCTSSPQMPVATSSRVTQPILQTTYVILNYRLLCSITDSSNKLVTELQSLKEEVQSLRGEMQSLIEMVMQLISLTRSSNVSLLETSRSSIDNSQLEFPLATEKELNQLETSLKTPEFKDSFMTKMVDSLSLSPQSSLKKMLNYIWEPKLSIRFTAYGTSTKLALTKCRFYKVIMSVIISKFVSATMSEEELQKTLKACTKAYFHDVRDRVAKRGSRRRVAVDNKKSNQRLADDTSMLHPLGDGGQV